MKVNEAGNAGSSFGGNATKNQAKSPLRASQKVAPEVVEFEEGDQLIQMTTENCNESYFESEESESESEHKVGFRDSSRPETDVDQDPESNDDDSSTEELDQNPDADQEL